MDIYHYSYVNSVTSGDLIKQNSCYICDTSIQNTMNLSRYSFLLIAVAACLAFNSCKKSKLNKETTTAEDNALAEDSFDDIYKNINEAAEEQNLDGIAKMGGSQDYTFSFHCASVDLNPPAWDYSTNPPSWNNTFPKTLTIDFGNTNCVGNDGKARRGKIVSVFSGKYNVTGTVITTTLSDYHVNDYHIAGTKKVTCIGTNSFTIDVEGTVTSPSGEQVTWRSIRTRKWIEGQNTNFWTPDTDTTCCMYLDGITDDVYSIGGTAYGTNRDGRAYTAIISVPLRVQFCGLIPEITEGVIEIQPDELKKRTVDFGNRTCDRTFTVSIGKKTYTKQY